ncbi:hypothetical protein KY084_15880 [Stakelama sp. CBK3Z-3]|uniref:Uncharacterized protein n=1 Tax=Stakelama flava TaxID=2860338 RepID=A0ABS6XQ42_9SPHN|nr:hypothetical protein [Stakelama flava]MBW4332332.1 hypothetical protein [Stakelama flava]
MIAYVWWPLSQANRSAAIGSEALGMPDRLASGFVATLADRFDEITSDADHAVLIAQAVLARVAEREALTIAFDGGHRSAAGSRRFVGRI